MSTCTILARQDLDALRKALRGAESRVKFSDGREVQYRSTDEILKAINATEKLINNLENPSTRVRRAFSFYINRGL